MRTKQAPLIRQRPDGTWERLVIGSLKAGPVYAPCSWDAQAWEHKQRLAHLARLLGLPRPAREAA